MRHRILLYLFIFLTESPLIGQITLDAGNFPKIQTYRVTSTTELGSLPFSGENLEIFLDTTPTSPAGVIEYFDVTDNFFKNDCDAYFKATMSINGLGYMLNYYYSTNENGFHENGIHIPKQAYSQGGLTGNPKDSIIFEEQKYILSKPRVILDFPVTKGYSHKSVSRRVAKFKINIPAFGLNYAPVQHVANVVREDTLTAWGKMKVYTPNGSSPSYDVLVLLSLQHQIDSFYLNGLPAPANLLTAFGQQQGQLTNVRNRLYYYRSNRAAPLLLVNLNEQVTAFTGLFFDADSLSLPSHTGELDAKFITTLFPNPTADYFIYNIHGMDQSAMLRYQIFDLSGKEVSSLCQMEESELGIRVGTSGLANGVYHLAVYDHELKIAQESFVVQR
ncbi:MAG: T9SS type A sorting domain-containing protein [Saprospiraceae bacterium]|nr:T9SS type A sorting domain-containing protein [Saprospiraceae bacterium]